MSFILTRYIIMSVVGLGLITMTACGSGQGESFDSGTSAAGELSPNFPVVSPADPGDPSGQVFFPDQFSFREMEIARCTDAILFVPDPQAINQMIQAIASAVPAKMDPFEFLRSGPLENFLPMIVATGAFYREITPNVFASGIGTNTLFIAISYEEGIVGQTGQAYSQFNYWVPPARLGDSSCIDLNANADADQTLF